MTHKRQYFAYQTSDSFFFLFFGWVNIAVSTQMLKKSLKAPKYVKKQANDW